MTKLISVLSGALFTLCLIGSEVVLFSTEGKNPEKQWQIRRSKPATTLKTGNWPDGSSETCMELNIAKYPGKGQRWPAIMLKMPFNDWTMADVLSFDVMAEKNAPLVMYLRDKAGHAIRYHLKPGPARKTVKIEIQQYAKQLNLAEITQLHLFMSDPPENYRSWFGTMKITMLDLKKKNRQFRKNSRRVWDFSNLSLNDSVSAEKVKKELELLLNKPQLLTGAELRRGNTLLNTAAAYQDKSNFMKRKTLKNGLHFGWSDPMEKVKQDLHFFEGKISDAPVLKAPRNASCSSQLILLGKNKITLTWQISGHFKSKEGEILDSKHITFLPIGYIKCIKNRHPFEQQGKWIFADPLLNYVDKVDVLPDCYQSMYLEVNVPASQKSGTYYGDITVCGTKLPLSIQVRNFTLPSGIPYPMIISSSNVEEAVMTAFPKKDWKWVRRYADEVHDLFASHRMPLDSLYHGVLPSALEMKAAAARGVWKINVRSMANDNLDSARIFMAKKAVERAKTAGLKDKLYFYAFDESTREKYPAMRRITSGLKKIAPDIPIVTTAYDYTFGIESKTPGFDIWCPSVARYEELKDNIAAARKRGKSIWWYVCCNPGPPYPNVLIENAGADHRLLLGMMAWKFKTDGFLYYAVLNWQKDDLQKNGIWKRKKLTTPLAGAPVVNWSGASWRDINGDGRLVYPGAEKPVPSLRLKLMRDGIEDYIALNMLSKIYNAGKQSEEWKKEAKNLLSISGNVIRDLKNFTKDHRKINELRHKIDDCIEKAEK